MRVCSVVIPVHNGAPTLAGAIRSALSNGAGEVIVVDDCSSDDSAEVARRFPQVEVICRTSPGGPAVARNEGLGRATGEFVLFLDADDELFDGALRALELEMCDGVVAAMGRFEAVDDRDQALDIGTWANEQLRPVVRRGGRYVDSPDGFSPEALVSRLIVPPPGGILIRRAVAQRVGGYNAGLGRSEDVDFLVRLSREGRLVGVQKTVLKYRRAPGQRSQATVARQRGRQRTLVHMVFAAPNRHGKWEVARGAAAHHFDRARVRRQEGRGVRDNLVALRSYALGGAFRALGVVAILVP